MNSEPEMPELEILTLLFTTSTKVPDGLGILNEIKYFGKKV